MTPNRNTLGPKLSSLYHLLTFYQTLNLSIPLQNVWLQPNFKRDDLCVCVITVITSFTSVISALPRVFYFCKEITIPLMLTTQHILKLYYSWFRWIYPFSFIFPSFLKHPLVIILVDPSSYHNILQPCLASHLQLCTIPTTPLSVMISNGDHIHCSSFLFLSPCIPSISIFHYSFLPTIDWRSWCSCGNGLLMPFGIPPSIFLHPSWRLTHHPYW